MKVLGNGGNFHGIICRNLVQSASDDLLQDHERLLDELEHMHQADRLRKRQQVSTVPSGIPQPLYLRQEAREDFQREMEFALEDVYTGERGRNHISQRTPSIKPWFMQNHFRLRATTS